MKGRSILTPLDVSPEEEEHLLDLSLRFRDEGIPRARPGNIVCGLFFDPSLRTRTSLEIASASLGAQCIVHDVGKGVWKLEPRDGAVMDGDRSEHVRDAVGKFLSGVVDLIGVRCFDDPEILPAIAEASDVPVLNLESPLFHPMQALADLLVLRNHLRGDRADHVVTVTWAWHPKSLPRAVPHTAVLAFARAGYRVRLAHPEGYDLDPEVMARARELAGDRLTVHHDMDDAVRGAAVLYAKSWGARGPEHRDWIVDRRRQALGRPGAFMHCLPVRRNVIVTDEVIDGPHSWVAEQARSRVLTQAAVLHEVL